MFTCLELYTPNANIYYIGLLLEKEEKSKFKIRPCLEEIIVFVKMFICIIKEENNQPRKHFPTSNCAREKGKIKPFKPNIVILFSSPCSKVYI